MSGRSTRTSTRSTRGQNPRFRDEDPVPQKRTPRKTGKKAEPTHLEPEDHLGCVEGEQPEADDEQMHIQVQSHESEVDTGQLAEEQAVIEESQEVVTSELVVTTQTQPDGTVAVDSIILGDLMGESIAEVTEVADTADTKLEQVLDTSEATEAVVEAADAASCDFVEDRKPLMAPSIDDVDETEEEAEEPVTKSKSTWHKKYDSNRRYRPEWETYFPWLSKENDHSEMAICTWCHHRIRPRIYTIEKHGETESHKKMRAKMAWEKKQRMILEAPQTPMCNPKRMAEEYRLQKVMMEIRSSQERFGKPPEKPLKGKVSRRGKANFEEKKKLLEQEKLSRLRQLQAQDLERSKVMNVVQHAGSEDAAPAEPETGNGNEDSPSKQQTQGQPQSQAQQQPISYTITPLATDDPIAVAQAQHGQQVQVVQAVQAVPPGATVVQQVQQMQPVQQFTPATVEAPSRPKKYFPDPVSAHILDQTSGCPAEAIAVTLWKMTKECKWSLLSTKQTNHDGRSSSFLRWEEFQTGAYKMHFSTGDYFKRRGLESFYPYIEIVFDVKNADEHFHIPLLISPFGYSTYRGT